jgi:N-acyl-D-aspartate/D-glutamate deacylase
MFDLVVRGGRIVDGSGAAPRTGDVAVQDGVIAAVGQVDGPARRYIDADGALVTPGFIDVHTHYDGQFLWDDQLDPSFSNGITTVVAGNCAVGFAPARPQDRGYLIQMMEGVEDIPAAVLDQALDWRWESFPDYLDQLARRRFALDIATHLPHAALRIYVMGERAARHEAATPDDLAQMDRLVREAMKAGAMGVSCSRIIEHRSSTGGFIPGTFARDDELLTLARAMGESGKGVFQLNPLGMMGDTMMPSVDRCERIAEHRRITAIAKAGRRPVTYSFLQFASDREDWRMMVEAAEHAHAIGLAVHPQTAARGVGVVSTLEGHHRFELRPSYRAIAHLPFARRLTEMRDPELRRAILSETDDRAAAGQDANLLGITDLLTRNIRTMFPLSLPLDYEPGEEKRLGALADAAGQTEEEYLYDHLVAGEGRNLVAHFECNYIDGNLDVVREMLENPIVISGLGDGGAHMTFISDSSLPTFELSFWARDRRRGERLPLETVVRKMTGDCARLYGLKDRGIIAPGRRADLNVIDHDRLAVRLPEMHHDLPTGAPRLVQRGTGYLATLVAGVLTRRFDEDTGARPGRLARS